MSRARQSQEPEAVVARLELGRRGEELAAQVLISEGLDILDRNWRCNIGEIDIVARDGDRLVIVEVKTRSSVAFGGPFEAVSPRKVRRLRRLAIRWLEEHQLHVPEIRFDVMGILRRQDGVMSVQHLRGVD